MIFNKFARVLRNILLRKNIETYSIQCMEFHALNLCKLIVIAEYVWRWAGWIFSGHEKSLQVKHLFTLFKLAFGLEKKSSGSGSAILLFECTFIFFECWWKDPEPYVDPDPDLNKWWRIRIQEAQVKNTKILWRGSRSGCRSRSGSEQMMMDPDPGGSS